MNVVDKVLLTLADPTARTALLDEPALEAVVAASYDIDARAPYTPLFEEFTLGPAVTAPATLDGYLHKPVSGERTEASVRISGLSGGGPTVAALWRGAVVARTARLDSVIQRVDAAWPALGAIDADIVADLGALPADPAALEAERRTRLRERLEPDQPEAVTDARLDALLAGRTVAERLRGGALGGVQVSFSAALAPATAPITLPVTAVFLARDAGFSLTGLLAETRFVRERLIAAGTGRATSVTLPCRTPVVAIWVLPAVVFDDDDWPGATSGMTAAQRRVARRAAAAVWLRGEAIALAISS